MCHHVGEPYTLTASLTNVIRSHFQSVWLLRAEGHLSSWTGVPKWTGWWWRIQNSSYKPQPQKKLKQNFCGSKCKVCYPALGFIMNFTAPWLCLLLTCLVSFCVCPSRGIIIIIFPSETPKFWRDGVSVPQDITVVILLLHSSCEKLSASLHYTPSLFNIRSRKQTGNLPVLFLLVLGKLKVRPKQTWHEWWLDVGADKKWGRTDPAVPG